jgi:hypothetical protein
MGAYLDSAEVLLVAIRWGRDEPEWDRIVETISEMLKSAARHNKPTVYANLYVQSNLVVSSERTAIGQVLEESVVSTLKRAVCCRHLS